jgi:integrase
MARIENRSRFSVTVKNRDDLTRTFPYDAREAVAAYIAELKARKLKPKASRLNDAYLVRLRTVGHPDVNMTVGSEEEAVELEQRIEAERRRGLFVDYAKGWRVSFGDLLARYLREEAPRQASFEILGYKINALLEDSGLPRLDLAEVMATHPNPHPKLRNWRPRKVTGKAVRAPSAATHWVRKRFAELMPEDINDYVDERCQAAEESTVDRELDIISAVCRIAIDTWRIPVAKSPMDGVKRPRYFNERDRRLKADEEQRLLAAARAEDEKVSLARRLEELMADERAESDQARTTYRRKKIVQAARAAHIDEAKETAAHVPLFETFVHFQLMTGARRGETLSLTWANVDLDEQTALMPETKNGRSRKLPLRIALVHLLRQLPRDGDCVFPVSAEGLRKVWGRICEAAGLVGDNELRIHDLRHEAISRVADAGGRSGGGFSLVDLQAFSGHRDTRMLLRYAHLCAKGLAKRLDAAFGDDKQVEHHHGVRRLRKVAGVTMADIVDAGVKGAAVATSAKDGLVTPNGLRLEFPTIVDPFPDERQAA